MKKALSFILASIVICCVICGCSDVEAERTATATGQSDPVITTVNNTTEKPDDSVPVSGTGDKTDDTPAAKDTVKYSLPESSAVMSKRLATALLKLCSNSGESEMKSALSGAGFTPLFTKNFDKDAADPSHTCAYAVGKGTLNGRNAYAIVIRGTSGGEWYSNFDFAPSHTDDSVYAENFMEAARDIYSSVSGILEADKDAYIFVCGHSRGAAAANLLGVLLDDNGFNNGDLYVYTYATPNTIKSEYDGAYNNVFNFINRKDIVTYLPPEYFGYGRAGSDIILNDGQTPDTLFLSPEAMQAIAPDVAAYYNNRYSFTEPGLSEDGMTAFEIMTRLGGLLGGVDSSFLFLPKVSEQSDLYPLVSPLYAMTDLSSISAVFAQHTPGVYMDLISKLG